MHLTEGTGAHSFIQLFEPAEKKKQLPEEKKNSKHIRTVSGAYFSGFVGKVFVL